MNTNNEYMSQEVVGEGESGGERLNFRDLVHLATNEEHRLL